MTYTTLKTRVIIRKRKRIVGTVASLRVLWTSALDNSD
jgi:hypothetical protein